MINDQYTFFFFCPFFVYSLEPKIFVRIFVFKFELTNPIVLCSTLYRQISGGISGTPANGYIGGGYTGGSPTELIPSQQFWPSQGKHSNN